MEPQPGRTGYVTATYPISQPPLCTLCPCHSHFQASVSLMEPQPAGTELPRKLAVVMGREADGVTEEMLQAATR